MSKRSDPGHGQRLREFRTSVGISQRELARQLDVHHSNVGFWERSGTVPRSELLPKLAKILGVSVEELLGNSNNGKAPALPESRLGRSFEAVRQLPRRQQGKILDVVDALIAQQSAEGS